MSDKPTPDVILNCPTFRKAYEEYQNLPHVTDDTWYCDGIQHLVYWAQHEINLVESGARQVHFDTCGVSPRELKTLHAFVKKWTGIYAEGENHAV